MIKQTRKPIQLTKSMLINILRDMEANHENTMQSYLNSIRNSQEGITSIHSKDLTGIIY